MNSYRYFENKECNYYPCHKGLEDGCNCLFCYCPMYNMVDCLGYPNYMEKNGKQIKVCTDCKFPHKEENYELVMEKLKQNLF